MRHLLDIAVALGVRVVTTQLPPKTLGLYIPDEERIYLDRRLTPAERRVVLAHELGHAHYGHACSIRERIPANERAADVHAARLLIDPAEYARLERMNSDRHALADELHVTPELIDVYRETSLTSLVGVTYARARHGARQWAHMELREHIA